MDMSQKILKYILLPEFVFFCLFFVLQHKKYDFKYLKLSKGMAIINRKIKNFLKFRLMFAILYFSKS
jgi:hypothetical protein